MTPTSNTEEPVLLSDDRDGVRTLTLNRPRRKNAINPQLWIALRDALNAAGRDRERARARDSPAPAGVFAPAPTSRSPTTFIRDTSCSA